MDNEEEESTKLGDFLEMIAAYASAGKDILLRKIVDDVVFPWYEAKTGKHNSNKVMRRHVADKIEQSLSGTLWITKGDALGIGEDGMDDDMVTPSRFIVGNVFPQSRTGGSYELMVALYQKGLPGNAHTLDLESFMRDFVPFEEVNFQDFDS